MTDYRRENGEVVEGIIVYARLREGTWSVVRSDNEDGTLVVTDQDGDRLVLTPIEGSERRASGPHIYTADEE